MNRPSKQGNAFAMSHTSERQEWCKELLCEEFRQKFRSPQSPSATSNLGGSIICEKGYKMLSLCLEWAIGGPIAPCGIGRFGLFCRACGKDWHTYMRGQYRRLTNDL
jgi:hypothetical protein